MESMLRWLGLLALLAVALAAAVFVLAGRGAPPSLVVEKPDRAVGQDGTLEVIAGAPGAQFSELTIAVEQDGRSLPLFSLAAPDEASLTQRDADHVRISRRFGKQSVPELTEGVARIVVTASRTSFFRTLSSRAVKDVQIRLEPPRIAVVSTRHYVNHGGSEVVLYRVTPPDVASGVRVGELEYTGYPADAAGVAGANPALRIAFFGLLHDQDLSTPIAIFARDEAGNETRATFVDNVFRKPFRRSRIALDDRFIRRVVPEILQHSPELQVATPSGDFLPAFLQINGELRRLNAERIASLTSATSPSRLWQGPFVQLGNSEVEASFADHRAYIYGGEEVDQQVHLGFDLAATAAVPVVAANAGRVLHAKWLGIYGNCVIVDHGLGLASLYGHLSSVDVRAGDVVAKGHQLGRSGMTGLAGGDHLHYTVLLQGRPVNPVEWWDAHWIEDRVERKLRDATTGGSAAGTH